MKSKLDSIFILLFFFCACSSIPKKANYYIDLKCMEAKQTFPMLNEKGKLFGYDEMYIRVYYYKDLKMYELPYRFDSIRDDVKIMSQDRKHFFVLKQGSTFGIDYNKYKQIGIKKCSVDSIFKFEWIKQNNLFNAFLLSSPLRISFNQNKDSGVKRAVYVFRDKTDTSRKSGYSYLKFSDKLSNYDVSLSKQLDSIYNMKLCNAKFIYLKQELGKTGEFTDQYESNFSLEEISVKNTQEILSYFNQYMNDIKKYQ